MKFFESLNMSKPKQEQAISTTAEEYIESQKKYNPHLNPEGYALNKEKWTTELVKKIEAEYPEELKEGHSDNPEDLLGQLKMVYPNDPEKWKLIQEEVILLKKRDEQIFHEGGFGHYQKLREEKAERYNKPGIWELLKRMWKGEEKITKNADDIMLEEAYIDNATFDKKRSTEYIENEKRLKIVIGKLKYKRDHPEDKEAQKQRCMLFIPGGGHGLIYTLGQIIALKDLNIEFDVVYTISSGAIAGSCFLGSREKALKIAGALEEKVNDPRYINMSRFWKMVNVGVMGEGLQSGEHALDMKLISENHAELVIQMTIKKSGEILLRDGKNLAEKGQLGTACEEAISLPWVTGKAPEIEIDGNKVEVTDGALTPMPIEETIKEQGADITLILPQKAIEDYFSSIISEKFDDMVVKFASKFPKINLVLLKKIFMTCKQEKDALKFIEEHKESDIAIMYPNRKENVWMLGTDSDFTSAFIEAYIATLESFSETEKAHLLEIPNLKKS